MVGFVPLVEPGALLVAGVPVDPSALVVESPCGSSTEGPQAATAAAVNKNETQGESRTVVIGASFLRELLPLALASRRPLPKSTRRRSSAGAVRATRGRIAGLVGYVGNCVMASFADANADVLVARGGVAVFEVGHAGGGLRARRCG